MLELENFNYQDYTLLIVDDNPLNLSVIVDYLSSLGFKVLVAQDGINALSIVDFTLPDLILLDVMMPGMDGFEVCRRFKEKEETREIPIIFMTALTGTSNKIQGFGSGGVDYVTKPIQHEEVLARVTTHLRLRGLTKNLQKQVTQLEINSQVAQQITSLLDPDELFPQIVSLIQSHFDYYFVGIWSLTETNELFLRAGADVKGTILPTDSHQVLLATPGSSVAQATQSGQPYLIDDISENPELLFLTQLPDTSSEIVLPLRVGDKTIGALDIHSTQTAAFGSEDKISLQMLADKIAIAIRNADLYNRVTRFNQHLEAQVQKRTQELQKAYNQLEKLDHYKTEFIAIASHELNTPLSLIKGYSQLLLADNEEAQNADNHLQLIKGIDKGVYRLQEVVNQMLDVAEIDNLKLHLHPEPISLYITMNDIYNNLKEVLKQRNLTLHITPELQSLDFIEADPAGLTKAFYNIIVNAIKYTPDGGQITVDAHPCTMELSDDEEAPGVAITFLDTGIGIDPEFHELIFTKFYQTNDISFHSSGKTKFKGGGPGLGLTIAHGIILAHQGRIWVESDGYDEDACPGSTFHVILPLNQQRPLTQPSEPQAIESNGISSTVR